MVNGLISNLQHFSVGDGPGIRTTVFMQGCNLKCPWCHNPETISMSPVLMFYGNTCTKCGNCLTVCSSDVHDFSNGIHTLNYENCIHCGKCGEVCISSLKLSGKYMSVDEVYDYVFKDIDYITESGGGVTISGGEPLLQTDFVASLAKKCNENNINVIIDTAGNVPFYCFEKVIPYTDTFYYDIKGNSNVYDEVVHGNYELVLNNLKRLVELNCSVVVRIPVIPSVNDSVKVMSEVYQSLKEIGINKVSLLPFHRLGSSKYSAINMNYSFIDTIPPEKERIEELADIFKGMDVEIQN